MSGWVPRPDGGRPSGRTCSHAPTAGPKPPRLSGTCLPCTQRGRARTDLLLCLTCGHVGCSDSSPDAHATAHFDSSGHPVACSLTAGQEWAWCYEDELYLDPLPGAASASGFAPGAQESVWDYPRPPAMREDDRHVQVECAGQVVADTCSAVRVLETSHPPVFYIPPADVRTELLVPTDGQRTRCEWKGAAQYWDLVVGDDVRVRAAWSYPRPEPAYAQLAEYFAFYPSLMDRCTVAGEEVTAQEGDFYGGWITAEVQGPFKGGPGTRMW